VTTWAEVPALPCLVRGTVGHHRRGRHRHRFEHRVYQWLVDVDHLPRLRPSWLGSFEARDHLGDPTGTLRANLERLLALHDIDLGAGSHIVMLTNARVAGYVFNPITVWWCFSADGSLRCIVAEVHNTYGDRHAYVVQPDRDGHAETDKALYVSPFNDVSGRYRMKFRLEGSTVEHAVTLVRPGQEDFAAWFAGTASPAHGWRVAAALIRYPLMPLWVTTLIRVHGIWLWLRRLPVQARPTHPPQPGVG
jgi:hypothetical protein